MTDLPPFLEGSEPTPGYAPPAGYTPLPNYPAPFPGYPVPTYGYQVPGGAPIYDMTGIGTDPLVTPPGQGFSGWWARLWKTMGRSWRSLVPILGLTSGLPGIVFGLFAIVPLKNLSAELQQFQQAQQIDPSTPLPADLVSDVVKLYALLGIYLVIFLIFGAVGWTASVWTITRQAAGEPAPFGRAMGYGLKNLPRTGGWLILYFLMVIAGSVCCLLPGLYFGVAGCLIVPFVIFSRGSISDSFRMVNKNFGAVLGRVATVYGLSVAVGLVLYVVGIIAGSTSATLSTPVLLILEIGGAIVTIPTSMVLVVGIALTFAEMRAREMLTTTAMLNQAL